MIPKNAFVKGLALLLFFCAPFLSAQIDDTVYVIIDIRYDINGKTRESALERVGGFQTGLRFTGLEALEEYVREKTQDLHNLRPLDENASSVAYSLGAAEPDGAVPVYLDVTVTDSKNLVILPEPKYDSNYGFSLSLKAREYNFLGTLATQKLDLVWGSDDKDRNYLGFLLDLEIPFRAFGYDWTFTSFNEFRYYLSGEPVYDTNVVGIAMELPVSFTTVTFGLQQGIVVHEENTAKTLRYENPADDYHNWYLFTRPYIDWEIPTSLRIGKLGKVVYTPGIYGIVNYKSGDIGDYRRGPDAGFKQDIGFGRIDWIGNFRHGAKVAFNNDNWYNFSHREWKNSVGLYAEGHLRISRFFGVSGRLTYTKWFNDYYEYAGDVIRGYKDDELEAKQRMSLNLDFPLRLIRFAPSEWRGNRSYRYFDFEQHWSLFIDLIMLDSQDGCYSFTPGDIITAAGLEVITFPLAWRSFYIRLSAGWNIREAVRIGKLPSGIHREIYIGLGHYY